MTVAGTSSLAADRQALPDDLIRRVAQGIVYSQCWEDPSTGRRALALGPDDDVLVITSGGCNVLALLLDGPKTVTALDFNPTQNHLLELKLAALRVLDHDGFLAVLGARPCRHRPALYARLRELLPGAARDFWDAHPGALAQGPIHVGRFERYLATFRSRVLPLIHPRLRIERLLEMDDLGAQRRYYSDVWDNRRWRLLLQLFLDRRVQSRLGRYPEFFRYAEAGDVGGHYRERARYALTELPVRGNWFVEYILTGTYRGAMPPYLREENFETLASRVDRIAVHSGALEAYLPRLPLGSLSAFYLSDVFEWMPPDRYEQTLRAIVRTARPGARLCYYNNLVPRRRPPSLAGLLESDEGLASELHEADRSFLYRGVVVERVPAR